MTTPLPCFQLTVNGESRNIDNEKGTPFVVTIELSSWGAAITRWLVAARGQSTDIVLSTSNDAESRKKNESYFGCIVGRVANRIAGGRLRLPQSDGSVKTIQLATNEDGKNTLHGGKCGFSHQMWNGKQIDASTVNFTLLSPDGDQGFPGTIKTDVTYTLTLADGCGGCKLNVSMNAKLLQGGPTPINLTQHSYFNLAGHGCINGVLDHHLSLPQCSTYLPVNESAIPTRDVVSVETTPAMDWRSSRKVRDALICYGIEQRDLTPEKAKEYVDQREKRASDCQFGFDHNYIIDDASPNEPSLMAVLTFPPFRLTVASTAPGVQLYTANHLDGSEGKDNKPYHRWQGLCLETQHFPNSVGVDESNAQLSRGACVVLSNDADGNDNYRQQMEYLLAIND